MRRLLVATFAIGALALGACTATEAEPAPAGASQTGEDFNAAMFKANCAEAAKINDDGAAAFNAGVDTMLDLAADGDQAALAAAEQDLRAMLTAWSGKLTEMSGRPVAPGALEEGAATLEKIADGSAATGEAKELVAHVGNKIRAACAGSS
ncbi:hypothetical protein DFJ67_0015 [Asanoa ferruginea]|uniref:Small secreted protein n=1 Tax=Asanoa ferruginea TaxID=53367 RepID=A0A3D9Z9N0_9ACTN|nr:hypothetical protein [Asanoa ferruginea]REF94106.1 hypothetical protein DFJ67_0015 [Asanoa ferruginea]GIF52603.1 hypothetical protein Afe04nite_71420 [Asanoa ferruginea]